MHMTEVPMVPSQVKRFPTDGLVFWRLRAPDIVYTKKDVLEHAVFLLKLLVLRSERAKPVFNYVQKHFYDPKHVLSYIILSNARDVTPI